MMGFLRRFSGSSAIFRQTSGATAIEYSLIAGIIAVTLYLALGVYYEALDRLFDSIIAAIPQA
ncbi:MULTISPECIES: Flp family type IVb pilin [Rhizobium/Agrobacterium group]|uniref:Flp family type IVb pilin n=1 Tax=Rhizobium/Agrobacterium group TaxID=227290 RepID=UPI000B406E03|nr:MULTISPECIES: Flp family type IVb pilin [Rhizobium/Agrobacterium group]OVE93492.1 hypothetical protein B7W85_14685 [Allorhizobium ampelinum]